MSGAIRGWQGTAGQPEAFFLEVAKGNIEGHSIVHQRGHAKVGTSMVPIVNSLVYQMPITAVALEILSDDADDTSAGAGARTIEIEGLALDGSIVIQVVALAGLTPVAIPIPLWRIYDWHVLTSGTYGTSAIGGHQGTLTIRVASAGATWFTMQPSPFPSGVGEIGWYTVPLGYRAYILNQIVKVDSTKSVDVIFVHRPDANIVSAPFSSFQLTGEFIGVAGAGSGISQKAPMGAFPAFTDMGWMGVIATGTADISVDFEILLIKDGH